MRTHTKERVYRCRFCYHSFICPKALNVHHLDVHHYYRGLANPEDVVINKERRFIDWEGLEDGRWNRIEDPIVDAYIQDVDAVYESQRPTIPLPARRQLSAPVDDKSEDTDATDEVDGGLNATAEHVNTPASAASPGPSGPSSSDSCTTQSSVSTPAPEQPVEQSHTSENTNNTDSNNDATDSIPTTDVAVNRTSTKRKRGSGTRAQARAKHTIVNVAPTPAPPSPSPTSLALPVSAPLVDRSNYNNTQAPSTVYTQDWNGPNTQTSTPPHPIPALNASNYSWSSGTGDAALPSVPQIDQHTCLAQALFESEFLGFPDTEEYTSNHESNGINTHTYIDSYNPYFTTVNNAANNPADTGNDVNQSDGLPPDYFPFNFTFSTTDSFPISAYNFNLADTAHYPLVDNIAAAVPDAPTHTNFTDDFDTTIDGLPFEALGSIFDQFLFNHSGEEVQYFGRATSSD
ncbi:hypothetical protein AX16_009485 [Volvariella volvacea WC 439]|nr:hypothetical protein AX16_009485 [Volvariella volvacea WC 439]